MAIGYLGLVAIVRVVGCVQAKLLLFRFGTASIMLLLPDITVAHGGLVERVMLFCRLQLFSLLRLLLIFLRRFLWHECIDLLLRLC